MIALYKKRKPVAECELPCLAASTDGPRARSHVMVRRQHTKASGWPSWYLPSTSMGRPSLCGHRAMKTKTRRHPFC
ncbi:hypothetical protein GDO81_012670 [Engystomops pustulosus]|uniref:Uncharacterized protein n=1 Tax=Engystomops pustulosus TaxID=76066 RepID=A0AAV7B324_ENGPU|nr:hypothetical protein GDO81_012670 [Engystomops pustulosus]